MRSRNKGNSDCPKKEGVTQNYKVCGTSARKEEREKEEESE